MELYVLLALGLHICGINAEINSNDVLFTHQFSLEQVHVLFRHGDRRPDEYCSEYKGFEADEFWPDGPGGLTRLGKKQEYDIGVALRERYGDWLGQEYTPEVMEARTTDRPRTKMSLLLVLAGLWPPNEKQSWNWQLNWQPIPIEFEKWENDRLLGWPANCPKFLDAYEKVLNSTHVQNLLKSKKKLFDYIFLNTLRPEVESFTPARPFEYMFGLYFCLDAMERNGKTIPHWTKVFYPEAARKFTILEYQLKTYNKILKRYTGGQLLRKIINDVEAKRAGKLKPEGRKLFLYSGHEFNVAHTLRALNSFTPHIPPYSSYIIFEVHNLGASYAIKVMYQDYKHIDPQPIIIPGCQEMCPFVDFVRILKKSIPETEMKC